MLPPRGRKPASPVTPLAQPMVAIPETLSFTYGASSTFPVASLACGAIKELRGGVRAPAFSVR